MLKPILAVPMHYGSGIGEPGCGEEFLKLCREKGIKAEIIR
jgi:hypothetical protein